jgi:pimeloyl-ACP methyl ester carboxylesterase
MPDQALLRSLSTHDDPALGISERFEALRLRTGRTVGVLSSPLAQSHEVGWLVCHSFGPEHWHLSATDVAVARSLSARGFPVLRFHCQGYGDSEQTDLAPSLSTHLSDTLDAADLLRSMAGVREIGLLGARFGAAIATLAAPGARAGRLALIDPVINGRRYVRELLRSRAIIELTSHGSGKVRQPDDALEDPFAVLRSGDSVNIRGFVITPEVFEEMSALDLTKAAAIGEAALIVQVSRGSRPSPASIALADRLGETGSAVSRATVSGRYSALFGDAHFQPEGRLMIDVLADMNRDIGETVADWAMRTARQPTTEGGA